VKNPARYWKSGNTGLRFPRPDNERVQPVLPSVPEKAVVIAKDIYTVADVAALTGLSRQTVTRMFERERGVLILERPEKIHKRRFRTIRIPRTVYERVVNRLSVR
jgi:hypothetical protein